MVMYTYVNATIKAIMTCVLYETHGESFKMHKDSSKPQLYVSMSLLEAFIYTELHLL